MSKRSDVFLAFLTGAAAGAAIGILFAPDKGIHTREKLSKYLESYKDKLKVLIKEYSSAEQSETPASTEGSTPEQSNATEGYITQAKSEGMKVVKDARSQAEALLEDVEGLIDQIKNRKS